MKVAFLTRNKAVFEGSFSGLAKTLYHHGNQVGAFYHPTEPPPEQPFVHHGPGEWYNFDFSALESFMPDRVVVFNGSFLWCSAATQLIRLKWKTWHAELAWLPQAYQIYLDPLGPGARSQLFQTPTPDFTLSEETLRALKNRYMSEPYSIAPGYILVPLQLEEDTSILYDSPLFKSMASLVGFVKHSFPEHRIVVKPHPLDRKTYTDLGVEVIPPKVPFHSLVSQARAIIGINSTTLIESLVQEKPVMALGLNVASHRGVFYEGLEALKNPSGILSYTPDLSRIRQVLGYLRSLQFEAANPSKGVVEQILSAP